MTNAPQKKNFIWLWLALLLLQSPFTRAASFEITTDPPQTCSAIKIEGEIHAGDYERFVGTLKRAKDIAPLHRVYLNSGGGNLGTALAITDVIRNTTPRVETIVLSRHSCSSACVILLTAGVRQKISSDATLKIHQAFNRETGKKNAELTQKMGQYLALNGLPPDVMWTMGNLKPDEQLAITPSNAKRLGFATFTFYGGTNPPATQQCSWDGFLVKKP